MQRVLTRRVLAETTGSQTSITLARSTQPILRHPLSWSSNQALEEILIKLPRREQFVHSLRKCFQLYVKFVICEPWLEVAPKKKTLSD